MVMSRELMCFLEGHSLAKLSRTLDDAGVERMEDLDGLDAEDLEGLGADAEAARRLFVALGRAPAAAPVPVGRGKLTVSSIPKAQVIVDGKFIRQSPLYRFDVAAGTRVITLIDSEGNRKTFRVEVPTNGEVRRVWSFVDNRFESE